MTNRDKQSFTLTFTPTGNMEFAVNLSCMCLDCKRKPEHLEGTHTDMGRTCYTKQTGQGPDSIQLLPGTQRCVLKVSDVLPFLFLLGMHTCIQVMCIA